MRELPDGTAAAWGIEIPDAPVTADLTGLTHEVFRDETGATAYELVGWPEAVAAHGIQPFFVRYWPPLASRSHRAGVLWSGDPGGGVEALMLTGTDAARRSVEGLLDLAGDGSSLDVQLRWRAGPPGLTDAVLAGGRRFLGSDV